MPPSAANIALQKLKLAKKRNRKARALTVKRSRVAALPVIPRVILDLNYVNPITLEFPKSHVVYEIKNRTTGRTNYYNKSTFQKLIRAFKNDYTLMLMNPKSPIPGARNPVTRGPIYPRNVRRVTVAGKKKTPSPKAAAKKIQSAVRKHINKKRASK
jgi:hypothetical protein